MIFTPLTRLPLQQTNRSADALLHWRKDGHLNLSPPYQRGDVWGPTRRVNFIRSLLLGIPVPSIVINDRFQAKWDDNLEVAVIDGKQRCTTLLMFFDGKLRIPSEWIRSDRIANAGETVAFSDLTIVGQRQFKNLPLPCSEGRLATIEDEQAVFELINFGGVPQGQIDCEE